MQKTFKIAVLFFLALLFIVGLISLDFLLCSRFRLRSIVLVFMFLYCAQISAYELWRQYIPKKARKLLAESQTEDPLLFSLVRGRWSGLLAVQCAAVCFLSAWHLPTNPAHADPLTVGFLLCFPVLCHLWFLRTPRLLGFFSSHTVVIFNGQKQEQFHWADVQRIEYRKGRKYGSLTFRTAEKSWTLPSARLSNGWMLFVTWTGQSARKYRIPLIQVQRNGDIPLGELPKGRKK